MIRGVARAPERPSHPEPTDDTTAGTNVSTDRDDTPGSAPRTRGCARTGRGAPARLPSRADRKAPPRPTANIGVVGLAVMGSNLARNLASREGNTVAIFNRSH